MAFSTLFFPFVFLPIALGLYAITPRRLKNLVLVLESLVFFAWGNPVYVVLMLLFIAFHYFTGLELERLGQRSHALAQLVLVSAVAVDLLALGYYKYYGFLAGELSALVGGTGKVQTLAAPIGISFFTFSALSYLFDVYRGKTEAARNVIDFSLYISFFPKLVSGPIAAWHDMAPQLRDHPIRRYKLSSGARRFVVGLCKKVLLANTLGTTFYALSAMPVESLSVLGAWLGALSYSLMLYFDFSGYSDMAIGLGEIFGFTLPVNFDYPYAAQSITDFWRRWHASLGAWFRDYVYIPLGGSRAGTARTIRNLLVVWLLTGIWHGASWAFVAWGLYHGVLLILEKFVFRRVLEHIPGFVRRVLTLVLVVLGWVFFFSPTLGSALGWLGRLFGAGGAPLADAAALYHLASCWKVLLLGAVGAMPVAGLLGNNLIRQRTPLWRVLSVVVFGVLLYFCVAGMLSDTYTSFLYFQF